MGCGGAAQTRSPAMRRRPKQSGHGVRPEKRSGVTTHVIDFNDERVIGVSEKRFGASAKTIATLGFEFLVAGEDRTYVAHVRKMDDAVERLQSALASRSSSAPAAPSAPPDALPAQEVTPVPKRQPLEDTPEALAAPEARAAGRTAVSCGGQN